MQVSAGILFILNNRALLAHSTNSSWWKTWMPPKGRVEAGESLKQAACREVEEEIGWRINESDLSESFLVQYQRSKKTWKQIHVFVMRLKNENDNRIKVVGDLQKEEVDSIQWMDEAEILKRCAPSYLDSIIKEIKK